MWLKTSAVAYCCYLREEAKENQSVGGTSPLNLAEEPFRNQQSFPLHLDYMATKIFQFISKEP